LKQVDLKNSSTFYCVVLLFSLIMCQNRFLLVSVPFGGGFQEKISLVVRITKFKGCWN